MMPLRAQSGSEKMARWRARRRERCSSNRARSQPVGCANWPRQHRGRTATFLDAPVTGSKPHAASGELRFLVGGSAEALEAARPVLAALGRDIVHLGPTGSGTTMKLVNNFLCGVQAASFAEAMALVEASGLDPEQAAKILANGAPGSPLIKAIWARAAIGDLTPNFVLRLMAKDLKYSLEEAKRHGLTLKAAIPAIEVFEDAVKHGYGDQDFAAVIEAQRQR